MANLLTAIRLLLTIPVAWGLAAADLISGLVLLTLILLAIITDYFDGIVARSTNTASAQGQLFDHGTDFLFVTCGLAGCAFAGLTNPYLPALIVVAFAQYVLDSYYLFRQKDLRMSFLGRWNGIFYFAPLLIIAVSRLDLGQDFTDALEQIAALTAWLLLASTVASIIDRAIAPMRRSEP
jgi:CDP-diacylglycerol---glycerol-3-phosphate 3-phosphatidyltransferase